MAKFFIDRPIFAWVISIFIIMAGLYGVYKMPIEQYPSVSAPVIRINFNYVGANAKTVQDSVISTIEEQMNAVDDIDYISSSAYSNGRGEIQITFRSGKNDDMAQVDVQNKLSQVESRIPQAVRNNGITVSQANSNFLLMTALTAKKGSNLTTLEIADYAIRNIKSVLQRIDGVGDVQVFGSEASMRIWVNPEKLKSYGLSFTDINNAIASQNMQVAAGTLGSAPAAVGQEFNASITIKGQLENPAEFENIVLKRNPSGATVKIKDVAVVELGQQMYSFKSRLNGQDSVGIAVQLASDGNAVYAAGEVKKRMEELAKYFPEGMEWAIPYDTSLFVKLSLEQVLHTLVEAVVLVFIVMFIFLQNIRYTIIPTIVVPISLLGALAVMLPLGMSVNVLTMFAMVLVIGIVVDDAIVVVENVERLMASEGLTPYEAAKKSMEQITGAVVGISLVLISVFVPMAFLTGATGAIYRQFSLVMATAIAFSAFMALSLTPALCATILKPLKKGHDNKKGAFGWFNRGFAAFTRFYKFLVGKLTRLSYFMMFVFLCLTATAGYFFVKLPTSFLPVEDQGSLLATYQLPSGATQERAFNMIQKVENFMEKTPEVENFVAVLGFSFAGQGENMALSFITLKDWAERTGKGQDAASIAGKINGFFQSINESFSFALNLPAIPSLGTSNGFSMKLQDRSNQGHEALLAARNQFLGMAMQSKVLKNVRPSGLEDATQLRINIDRELAYTQNVNLGSIAQTLGTAIGSNYINDFPNRGRMQRVYVMAQADKRMQVEDILSLTVPSNDGRLVPLSTFASVEWIFGPQQLDRYNNYDAMSIQGEAQEGYSSGDAMNEVMNIANKLPPGFAVEWTGLSLEEQRAGNSQLYLYAFSALAVFLCLAALYESWSIPFAVILVIPLGVLGAVFGNLLRGYENDIYFKIGFITVMGLSAKNAILIIEFAKDLQASGMGKVRAAIGAAQLRFRPILMTSLAFICGVLPLYFATGASSASQRAIGTTVAWGMSVGTFLAVFLVPIFYIVVRKIFGGGHDTNIHTRHISQAELDFINEGQVELKK